MIGQTIEAKSPVSMQILVAVLLGGILVVVGFYSGLYHFWMAALLPFVLAVVWWVRRPSDISVTLEEAGIAQFYQSMTIPYDSIQAVLIRDQPILKDTVDIPAGPILVVHEKGKLLIPEKMNVDPIELVRFLIDRVPQREKQPVHVSLSDFAKEQENKFGADKVICIHQRRSSYAELQNHALVSFGISLLLCGFLWGGFAAAYGDHFNRDDSVLVVWLSLGFIGVFLGPILWLYGRSKSHRSKIDTDKYGPACIVISSAGMAMAQGELRGKLRWDEIREIKDGSSRGFNRTGGKLRLVIEGGEIEILDVYETSLVDLASLITSNIRPTKW